MTIKEALHKLRALVCYWYNRDIVGLLGVTIIVQWDLLEVWHLSVNLQDKKGLLNFCIFRVHLKAKFVPIAKLRNISQRPTKLKLLLKPGSHMPPNYLRHSHRRACDHDSSCWRRRIFPYMYVGTVSQAVPAAMSQVVRRHMRTRL